MNDKKKKILLCEDEEFLARSYSYGLKSNGYEVIVAVNGNEALEMIETKSPDLVLLDLMMPEKSGFDVLKEVKRKPEIAHIPIIVTSNLSQQSDIDLTRSLGAVAYLVKSNTAFSDVLSIIEKHLPV